MGPTGPKNASANAAALSKAVDTAMASMAKGMTGLPKEGQKKVEAKAEMVDGPKTSKKWTNELFKLARKGELSGCLLAMEKGADVGAVGAYRLTPLMIAVMQGHESVAQAIAKAMNKK